MRPIHCAAAAVALAGAIVELAPSALAQEEYCPPARVEYFNPPPPPSAESPYNYKGYESYRARIGPQLGARIAYAGGSGGLFEGTSIYDGSNGALPIMIDLGWRFLPALYLGLYGQFAPVFTKENPVTCPAGFNCSATDWRFGVQADIHFIPRSRLDPYFGIGTGYEILAGNIHGTAPVTTPFGVTAGQVNANTTDRGYEFFNASLGADIRVDQGFGIGPFFTFALGRYAVHEGTQTVNVAGTTNVSEVSPVTPVAHELYIVGMRGTFNP